MKMNLTPTQWEGYVAFHSYGLDACCPYVEWEQPDRWLEWKYGFLVAHAQEGDAVTAT